jgi:hypothetical protein
MLRNAIHQDDEVEIKGAGKNGRVIPPIFFACYKAEHFAWIVDTGELISSGADFACAGQWLNGEYITILQSK